MKDFETKSREYFQNIDNAQLEIYQTIFPWHPPSSENLLQVKPMIANKSYLLSENIPDIKDFEIIPNSFLL